MSDLTYTLVTDGSSDQVLTYPINWLIHQHSYRTPIPQWADPTIHVTQPHNLREKIEKAVTDYPCELLFVHRDSEAEPRAKRVQEIQHAIAGLASPPVVCTIPVRMTEAWFLFEANLLRRAAGNPKGTMGLNMPPLKKLEVLPDPKAALYDLLRQASGAEGRRATKFKPARALHRLAELIEDYSPLRTLKAFRSFEAELRLVLQNVAGTTEER